MTNTNIHTYYKIYLYSVVWFNPLCTDTGVTTLTSHTIRTIIEIIVPHIRQHIHISRTIDSVIVVHNTASMSTHIDAYNMNNVVNHTTNNVHSVNAKDDNKVFIHINNFC